MLLHSIFWKIKHKKHQYTVLLLDTYSPSQRFWINKLMLNKNIVINYLSFKNSNDKHDVFVSFDQIQKVKQNYIQSRLKEQPNLDLNQLDLEFDSNTRNIVGMYVAKTKKYDVVVGGYNTTSKSFYRSALRVLDKTTSTISSAMVLNKKSQTYIVSDPSFIIEPTEEQLVDITKNAMDFSKKVLDKPTGAFMSFSTNGSNSSAQALKMSNAAKLFSEKYPHEDVYASEVQVDAALNNKIREKKDLFNYQDANVFVFPDLNSANISYKFIQQLGKFNAYGPFVLGFNQTVADLSRGATIKDIIGTILISILNTNKE
ncbi:phosphate acyltransferase [Mycoplasma sp. 4404]|uniref:phosphate acyltransferase n=1 Tax=Mycoplasma sp. 4404 TaxID=3108530 RepID=UPI002B1DAFBE|nr:phosphate acyltransferase [Mycoplasma sp. 4404]MEA4162793.1 phosphate acyltransferase [Mycoplasma sp. 4404]